MDEVKLNPKLRLKGLEKTLRKEATATLWKRGDILGFLLDTTQMGMFKEADSSTSLVHVILCSRRLGKSYLLSAICIEKALQKPNQQIKYVTGTQRAARDIVLPLFREILSTCPDDLRPEWRVHENKWKFKNGSEIGMFGVDATGGDDLRGQSADFYVVDEAGFIPKLDVLVTEILNPMIIQRDGKGVLSSTPPRSQGHPFIAFIAKAEREKALTKRTIDDCPRFTPKMIKQFEDEAGGRDSEVFRRECLVELIFMSEDSVIPEFTSELEKACVYSGRQLLNYVPDRYVSLDPGFSDACAVLFGYYSFMEATLYIEREYSATGNNTEEIAGAIKAGERDLWGGLPPLKRISDTDLRLIKDLKDMHGLKFFPTKKDMKEASLNQLRIMIKQGRIKIHESCIGLRQQLKYGQWKTSSTGKRDFARSKELGHLDLIDSLLYMMRNINTRRDPTPDTPFDPQSYWAPSLLDRNRSKNAKNLAKAFK